MNKSPENSKFSYTTWHAKFIRATLIVASVFGLVAVIPAVIGTQTEAFYKGLYVGVYLILLIVTVLPAPYLAKAGVIIFLVLSFHPFQDAGNLSPAYRLYIISPVFTVPLIIIIINLFSEYSRKRFSGFSRLDS